MFVLGCGLLRVIVCGVMVFDAFACVGFDGC